MPRSLGELERAVMDTVWARPRPVTGREVVDELTRSRQIAYTTVLTVMDRLVRKGLLAKDPAGRAHAYRAVTSRESYVAGLMAGVLSDADDPSAVLLRFLERLPADEAARLRAALDGEQPPAAS